jgi:hydrogenase-1 operon protein HyaF
MSGLKDIAVKVVAGPGYAGALLHELVSMLEALVARGEENAIDLRSLPLAAPDYEQLKALLGQGEVRATLQVLGPSHVVETAYPGVWWVTHCDPAGEVTAECIEVTWVPEMLKSHPLDVGEGLVRLRKTLQEDEPCDTKEPDRRDA